MRTRTFAPKEHMLQQLTIFRGLNPKELQQASMFVDETTRPAGWVLMQEGQAGQEAYIIVDGTATVSRDGQDIATLGPGDTVGEMALLDALPRSATVTADTEISVVVVTPQSLTSLLAIPSVARALIRSMATRLRRAQGAPDHW